VAAGECAEVTASEKTFPPPYVPEAPVPVRIDTTPMESRLDQIQPVQFAQVRRTPEEPLFNSLMEQYH
jgi:hypothetical protein